MEPALVVALPLALAAVALLAFRRGYVSARRNDEARVRVLVDIVADAMAVAGDRSASDAVVRRLADVLRADAAAVGYVDAGRLHLFGMHGYDAALRTHSLAKGEGIAGQAWEEGRPIVVDDVRKQPGYLPGNGAVRSGVYVPGKVRGRVTLVLCAESTRVGAYSATDVLLVAPLADLIASMIESRRMLREAEQLEERLLTLVSHEMRTPLTTILGTLSTLRDHAERIDPGSRETLVYAGVRASRRLERLVEALLTAARLDADDLTFRRGFVRVDGTVTEAVGRIGAADRVAVDVPASLRVVADAAHLGTVLEHLVENAVVHGGDGPVEVVANDGDAGLVAIRVRDVGPGIPEDQQEAALGRFRRVGEPTGPGTGLGLYVARRLVEGMGGALEIRSAAGRGCTVVVRLPAAPSAVPGPRQPADGVAERTDVGG